MFVLVLKSLWTFKHRTVNHHLGDLVLLQWHHFYPFVHTQSWGQRHDRRKHAHLFKCWWTVTWDDMSGVWQNTKGKTGEVTQQTPFSLWEYQSKWCCRSPSAHLAFWDTHIPLLCAQTIFHTTNAEHKYTSTSFLNVCGLLIIYLYYIHEAHYTWCSLDLMSI